MTDSSPVRLHAHVYGLVQGVYFRDTTRQTANSLRLTGWVRNMPDGSVEVVAEGLRPALDSLLKFLHAGPGDARVERVAVEWGEASGEFIGFTIRY